MTVSPELIENLKRNQQERRKRAITGNNYYTPSTESALTVGGSTHPASAFSNDALREKAAQVQALQKELEERERARREERAEEARVLQRLQRDVDASLASRAVTAGVVRLSASEAKCGELSAKMLESCKNTVTSAECVRFLKEYERCV